MSTQIDIVPERRKPGQGSWVGGSTATFDDRYQDGSEKLLAGLLLLACNGLGDPSHEDTVSPFQCTNISRNYAY